MKSELGIKSRAGNRPDNLKARVLERRAYLLALLPPLFWAGNFLVARFMREAIPPFQMSFWRWVTAFLIVWPLTMVQKLGRHPQSRRDWLFMALLGLVGVTAFNCFLYQALHHTTVVNAALINSLMPVIIFLLAIVFLGEPLTVRQAVGIALALSGAALIIARGDLGELAELAFNWGDLLVVAGVTFWSIYTVLIRWRPTRLPPTVFLARSVGFGILFHLPLVAWELRTLGGFSLTPASAITILYLALFSSVFAYFSWNRAVSILGAGRTGTFMYLLPIFAALLGVWLLNEPFFFYHVVGIFLIFSGIALVTRLGR